MKNIQIKRRKTYCLFLSLLFIVFFNACKKDFYESTRKVEDGSGKLMAIPRLADEGCLQTYGSIELENNMLVFDSYEQFESILECLRAQVEAHNIWFDSQYGHFTPEVQQKIIEETGFEEFQPLTDFEGIHEFTSLRQTINAGVTLWLQNDVLDFENDPDRHPILEDELRALLNPDAQVKIGETIYDFDADATENTPPHGACIRTHSAKNDKILGNLRFDLKVSLAYYLVGSIASAKVRAFERKQSGGWRPYRITMWAHISEMVRDNQCLGSYQIPNQMRGAIRSTLTDSYSTSIIGGIPFPMSTIVSSCEVRGFGAIIHPNPHLVVCL